MIRALPLALALALGFFLSPNAAGAKRPKVVIVRPADPVAVEAVMRIEGELVASGFDTVVVLRRGEVEPRSEVENVARENRADAALSIVDTVVQHTAEVWIADRLTGKTLVRRLQVMRGDGRAAAALAVQIVELLRASLLELLLESQDEAPSAEPPAEITRWVGARLPDRPRSLSLEAGPAVLHSVSGVGPNLSAVVRASYRFVPRFSTRLSLLIPLTRTNVTGAAGTAAVGQGAALAELTAAVLPTNSPLRPNVSAGFGLHRVDLQGAGSGAYVGRSDVGWGAAASAGLGLELRLGHRLGVSAEVLAILMLPRPKILIGGVEEASAGRPTVAGTLTLMTWL